MSDTVYADGCYCGQCDESCLAAVFRPCCGACMVGTPFDPDGEDFRYWAAKHRAALLAPARGDQ